jgi:sulfopyruvate decarboxylase alpha subunit
LIGNHELLQSEAIADAQIALVRMPDPERGLLRSVSHVLLKEDAKPRVAFSRPTKRSCKENSLMAPTWPAQIYELLKGFDARQVAYVPDAGHAELIRLCQSDTTMQTVSLTTEEEGVAMLCGAWLGGHHGVLLMQSSGVGNCINMLTLNAECRIPLLMLVTMRGDFGEGNPQQMPMGRGAQAAMEAVGVVVLRADRADDVADSVRAAARMAFLSQRAVALLIGQRVIDAKAMTQEPGHD